MARATRRSAEAAVRPSRKVLPPLLLAVLLPAAILSGCAASRTAIQGAFQRPAERNAGAGQATLLLLFRHHAQQHGYDTIPKVQAVAVKDFQDILRDSLGEISNLASYDTFTEQPYDVHLPARREEQRALREKNDYTLEVTVLAESSFKRNFLSGAVSLLSLTVLPAPYSTDYTFAAELRDRGGKLVGSYGRRARLTYWVQALLVFAYPFYPLEARREEVYSESLRDIFRQIETEKVLKR